MTESQKKLPPRLVWIDMEMSGLNPRKEVVLEIATIITDENLEILEEGPDLVIYQPEEYLDGMDEWNKKHHQKSGLIDAVKHSTISTRQAEKQTLDFIKKHCQPRKGLLSGNSIHHDRRFLERHMPFIHEYLHYRHVDVSTIKTLAQFWYPKLKKDKEFKKSNTHRALQDIKESIEELKYFRKKVFKARIK